MTPSDQNTSCFINISLVHLFDTPLCAHNIKIDVDVDLEKEEMQMMMLSGFTDTQKQPEGITGDLLLTLFQASGSSMDGPLKKFLCISSHTRHLCIDLHRLF